jgi:hypothetical protein
MRNIRAFSSEAGTGWGEENASNQKNKARSRSNQTRLIAAVIMIAGTLAARAEGTGPIIVIPGRAGVPVLINGLDASYGVVEGDWGLAKNIHVEPTVYYGHPENPPPPVGHYFPSSGRIPGYGRLEIEPPPDRKPQPEAESFTQTWSAGSYPPPRAVPAQNPPPVIVAPQFNGSPSSGKPKFHSGAGRPQPSR